MIRETNFYKRVLWEFQIRWNIIFFSLLENIISYKNKLWQKLVLDMENIQKLFHFCYKSQTIFFAMNIKIGLIPIFFLQTP